jgi:hypothetical protein
MGLRTKIVLLLVLVLFSLALPLPSLSAAPVTNSSLSHPTSVPMMAETGTIPMSGQSDVRVSLVDPARGYAYFGLHGSASGSIARVRLSDFTVVDTISLNADERGVYTGVIDPVSGFAYFGTSASVLGQASPSTIVKVNLATFTRVGSLTLNDLPIVSSAIDLVNGNAYFATNGNISIPNNPQLVKVNLTEVLEVTR